MTDIHHYFVDWPIKIPCHFLSAELQNRWMNPEQSLDLFSFFYRRPHYPQLTGSPFMYNTCSQFLPMDFGAKETLLVVCNWGGFHYIKTLVVVVVFSNFVIITGDSLGNTQFWDGQQGTLIQVQSNLMSPFKHFGHKKLLFKQHVCNKSINPFSLTPEGW